MAVLAACYSPGYEDCEITCAEGACPAGFSCDKGFCRIDGFTGSCTGDPNGDNDTDGVLNGMDNCPDLPNVDQANEDNDTFGDLCDPCPIKSDAASNMDSDSDGVGDGCDPFPNQPSQITIFEGFNKAPATNPKLLPSPSSWIYSTGKASLTNPGPNMVGAMMWAMTPTALGEVVIAGYAINQPSTSAPTGAGVIAYADATATQGIVCWVARETFGEGLVIQKRQVAGSHVVSPYALVAAASTSARLTRTGDVYTCVDRQDRTVMNTYAAPTVSNPQIGIFAMSAGVTFEYVMVVTRTQ